MWIPSSELPEPWNDGRRSRSTIRGSGGEPDGVQEGGTEPGGGEDGFRKNDAPEPGPTSSMRALWSEATRRVNHLQD